MLGPLLYHRSFQGLGWRERDRPSLPSSVQFIQCSRAIKGLPGARLYLQPGCDPPLLARTITVLRSPSILQLCLSLKRSDQELRYKQACAGYSNFFIYQARESSMVPAGFLIAQFLQKHLLSLCFDGQLRWGLSALIA